MILSIISAGTKTEKFTGNVVKVGAQNSIKLVKDTLDFLKVGKGDYAYMAKDENGGFHIAGSTNATSEAGDKGSTLGVVGEKKEGKSYTQLSFTHAQLGAELSKVASVLRIEEGAEGFDYAGLTFYPLTIIQTAEEAAAEKAAKEQEAQASVDAAEDKAVAKKSSKVVTEE